MDLTIGERLKVARARKGITLTQLCQATGISPATLSRFENNQQAPKYVEVEAIAEALDFAVDFAAAE